MTHEPSDASVARAFREAVATSQYPNNDYSAIEHRAREIEASRDGGALPELPEPALDWPTGTRLRNGSRVLPGTYYTAEQMRAYGEACRRMPMPKDRDADEISNELEQYDKSPLGKMAAEMRRMGNGDE